ncbi:hypothetical protein AFL01nite_20810 [Aeromicrobium flavum]|uniref:Serine aminopeptidase S33 domain-containing protein n=1 Tax=Aeromicrobium flavum TaxID=416568 RepID=A0A512HWD5_9ACTN|nr:alpha/beta fold hydrolase [Aeromicrobium flavum]GEO89754.1 hypothetical protein AFL01nite_20810 [Aeromicrobium flavum]
MTSPTRRTFVRGLLVVLLTVGTVMAMLWALQRRLIYYPDAAPVPPAVEALPGARDVTLQTADGLDLGAWFVPATARSDTGMAVLVAPGNGGNRAGRADLARELSRRGLAVLLMDYRGYGGNPGRPGEEGLGTDADAAVRALEELGYPPGRTLYFGESIGSGVVAALQARHPPAGVVLRSPFTALADVGAHHYPWLPVRLLLRDRFPVVEHLATSDVPVHRDLRRPRLGGADRAQRPRRGRGAVAGRARRHRPRRPQRPRHVRSPGGRRRTPAGAPGRLSSIRARRGFYPLR